MRLNHIDTSKDQLISRHGNGIKLMKGVGDGTQQTVGTLLQLPFNVYFINANGINQIVNEHDAESCGFDSAESAIGNPCFHQFTKRSIAITTANDKLVMQTETTRISEESVTLNTTKEYRPTLSIKMPWYANDDNIIGIFGCSIILGKHSLADSLSLISTAGLLNQPRIIPNVLSARQLSCARLILSGMTAKEIAFQLGISPRTVEMHVEAIKIKLSCRNRTDLISKLMGIMRPALPLF